jgi:NTE family protein
MATEVAGKPARTAPRTQAGAAGEATSEADPRKPHKNVLVLQGGGALGAYHVGVVEEVATLGIPLHWVCGISIGAINAALLAGNPEGQRISAMLRFWAKVTSGMVPMSDIAEGPMRDLWSEGAAFWVATQGVPGFFKPRLPHPKFQQRGSIGAISYYDTEPLRQTLLELIDFDYLNDGPVRLSVGAVSVTTGRMHFFDSKGGRDQCRIGPEHIMASGALPPGFPPVQIGADWFWDGGVASNAPLQHVLDEEDDIDKNILQVDLFPAEGPFPQTLLEAETRAQDIRYSSRTRFGTNLNVALSPARRIVRRVLDSGHPEVDFLSAEEKDMLERFAYEPAVEIAQIVYRDKAYAGKARGFEFSRPTAEAHRNAGIRDASRIFALRDWHKGPAERGVKVVEVNAPVTPRSQRRGKFTPDC